MNTQIKLAIALSLYLHFHYCLSQDDQRGYKVFNMDEGDNQTPKPDLQLNTSTRLEDIKPLQHFSEPYSRQVHGRLEFVLNEITSTTITVSWSLPDLLFADSRLESSIICESATGYIVSNKHLVSPGDYKLERLRANTSYIVCVYMLEKSNSRNSTVLHYSCHRAKTKPIIVIPSIRADSVIAVILTLGYLIMMIVIGYLTWRWRVKKKAKEDEAKQRLAIEDDSNDYEVDGYVNVNNGFKKQARDVSDYDNADSELGACSHGFSMTVECGDSRSSSQRNLRKSVSYGQQPAERSRDYEGSRGDTNGGVGFVTFNEADVVVERKSNSADKLNDKNRGRRDMKRAKSMEASPVKVTEICF